MFFSHFNSKNVENKNAVVLLLQEREAHAAPRFKSSHRNESRSFTFSSRRRLVFVDVSVEMERDRRY